MIINSLLDTDLYKITMQQAVFGQFPQATAEYAFKCRTPGVDLTPYADEIREEVAHLCCLRFTEDELAYLSGIRYLKHGFVESLRRFALEESAVQITTDGGEFRLRVVGNWYQTILFEVPLLAIVNEVYSRRSHPPTPELLAEGERRLLAKCEQINRAVRDGLPLPIIEFGTRRRYSGAWQRRVVQTLRERIGPSLIGTSNIALAREFGMKAFGTMAHEFLQAGQVFAPLPDFQKFALEAWMQEYRGDLGIALSDVVGMDAFLRDFDLLFSKAYDGARHDSGDPFEWGEKLIAHYERMGIDPHTKSAVFSDSLDIPKVIALADRFQGRIRTSFGIGTNLTNDLGFAPLQIVMKLVRCNGRPVVKVSDSPGKSMSEDPLYLSYIRSVFGLA
jgi:nicotinate phosphoribosyltransferase